MTLSEEDRERLADIVELQPTKNGVLQERWEMDSGSDVHQYLESELRDYYYRDEDSLIRATAEATRLVGEGGDGEDAPAVHMSENERRVFGAIAGPEERAESVVSVLHAVRDAFDAPEIESADIRRALQTLKRKGIVEVEHRTVPTYKLAVSRGEVNVEGEADEQPAASSA